MKAVSFDQGDNESDIDALLEEIDRHEVTLQPFTQQCDSLPVLGETPGLATDDLVEALNSQTLLESGLRDLNEYRSASLNLNQGLSESQHCSQLESQSRNQEAMERNETIPVKNPYVSEFPSIPYPFVDPSQMRLVDNVNALKPAGCVGLTEVWKLDRYSKVPLCIGMIIKIIESKLNHQVLLADGEGEIEACLHGRLSPKPHRGMIMVMQHVSLFAPTDRWRCLIVCPRNLQAIHLNLHQI